MKFILTNEMNANVATYSGTYMPHMDKSNLRLDLNLMNLNMTNSSSTPCTPNGKIKVYMNNIASNVTKVKNASTDCKEWRRCRFDRHNCISLEGVLETFNSSISEEQAWAICFSFIKCIQTLKRKGFKFRDQYSKSSQNDADQNEFAIYLHKDGYVHEKTIFQYIGQSYESYESANELNGIDDPGDMNQSNELNGNDELNGLDECDLYGNDLLNTTKELNEREVFLLLLIIHLLISPLFDSFKKKKFYLN